MNINLERRMDRIHPVILNAMPKGNQWYKNFTIKQIDELEIKIAKQLKKEHLIGDFEKSYPEYSKAFPIERE